MSAAGHLVSCVCCGDPTDEAQAYVDPDLVAPVCVECKALLQWAHAHLRRRTPQGVSITGIHGPREQPIQWDPHIAEAEGKHLDS